MTARIWEPVGVAPEEVEVGDTEDADDTVDDAVDVGGGVTLDRGVVAAPGTH